MFSNLKDAQSLWREERNARVRVSTPSDYEAANDGHRREHPAFYTIRLALSNKRKRIDIDRRNRHLGSVDRS